MAGRPPNRSSQPQAGPAPSARQNEYFVPRDGIDREVITSDICRYLGNDALVRPGTYEVWLRLLDTHPLPRIAFRSHECPVQSSDGRVTQGYFITAYRNLTSVSGLGTSRQRRRAEAKRDHHRP